MVELVIHQKTSRSEQNPIPGFTFRLAGWVLSSKRQFSVLVAITFFVLSFHQATSGQDQRDVERQRPNIVLLIADDLGYGELGCQGNDEIPTPNIDRLARDGARFTQGYVTASYCSSSRAGLITGRYQTRFGYEFNPIGADNEDPFAGLPSNERTIANRLHDAGYVTGLIGKWHLGGTARNHPLRRGFDEFFGFTHEGHYYLPSPYRGALTMLRRRVLPNGEQGRLQEGAMIYSTHMGTDEPAYDANNPILRGGQPVEEEEYLTDALTREAVDFIDRHHENPFFLMLAYNAVHSPLQAKEEDLERFAHIEDVHRRIFAAMLASLDDSVGKVTNRLEEHGILDNTLVIFFSDNGGPTRELTSSNAPLRGGKGSVYEGGLRIPFIAHWPDRIAAQTSTLPVTSLDFAPTFAEVSGNELANDRFDGLSWLQLLDENGKFSNEVNRDFFWRMNRKVAFRSGNWKMVGNRNAQGVVKWELYDLESDISESTNLAESKPEVVRRLGETWQQTNSEMIDPIWSRR